MCKITLIRIYNETCTYKTCNNILVISSDITALFRKFCLYHFVYLSMTFKLELDHTEVYRHFKAGHHVLRRTDRFWGCLSTVSVTKILKNCESIFPISFFSGMASFFVLVTGKVSNSSKLLHITVVVYTCWHLYYPLCTLSFTNTSASS
jgi:hypothetical protein